MHKGFWHDVRQTATKWHPSARTHNPEVPSRTSPPDADPAGTHELARALSGDTAEGCAWPCLSVTSRSGGHCAWA